MSVENTAAMPKMKFTLDYSKWICGEPTMMALEIGCSTGKGRTALLNPLGFMCCLGQLSLQMGATEKEISGLSTPALVKPFETKLNPLVQYHPSGMLTNSELSSKAMNINDNRTSTIDEKIMQLTELFAEHNIEMVVINRP